MIVRNLDMESTEDSIRAAFQYITKKPILDIRLAKDKFVSQNRYQKLYKAPFYLIFIDFAPMIKILRRRETRADFRSFRGAQSMIVNKCWIIYKMRRQNLKLMIEL